MHVGMSLTRCKTEAMFFLSSLKQEKQDAAKQIMPENLCYSSGTRIKFTRSFKYLGSKNTPNLNKNVLNKKVQMWESQDFF
jgi:hypothetical protein